MPISQLLYTSYSCLLKNYPSLQPLSEVVAHVEKGYRMESPEGCPDHVYKVMKDCWDINPKKRPTFKHVRSQLNLFMSQWDRDRSDKETDISWNVFVCCSRFPAQLLFASFVCTSKHVGSEFEHFMPVNGLQVEFLKWKGDLLMLKDHLKMSYISNCRTKMVLRF